ncbi:hypothetical protein ACFY04_43200 [Streptomyces sp. NPDC001549]|uniref:hypothetical protein n=1 Tax=Streptomyces sp. NPDC001549 TaxID=3364586 RepID=UPI0036B8A920
MGTEIAAIVGSGVLAVLGLLLRSRPGRTGLWEVLGELARGRTAAATERERRATVLEVLDRLPTGGRLVEVDERGCRRTVEVHPQARRRP